MNEMHKGLSDVAELLSRAGSTEHIRTILDYFAEQVDHQLQNTLMAETTLRYAELSKQLEEKNRQLAKSDASRREAQKIALLGNWDLELSTGQLHWSDTLYEVLELDKALVPRPELFVSLVHPDDQATAQEVTKAIYAGNSPAGHQFRLLMGDGHIKWVELQSVTSFNANGSPVSVRGTLQNVTASKNTEVRLLAYNDRLEELVSEKVAEISDSQMATIYALVKLAESRDDDTGDHIGRTSEYCWVMAERLRAHGRYPDEVNAAFLATIVKASPLHDIGKVGIPDAILCKPGKLSPEEFEVMKRHVIIGYETLSGVQQQYKMNDFIRMGMEITLSHHEKWDGGGYPLGLKGEEIPVSARIMALADVYDALRSKRVYKDSYSHSKSLEIINQGRDKHFDPLLTDIFLENHEVFRDIFDRSVKLR